MWVGNRFHQVDNKGRVIIPYGASAKSEKAVLVHNDYAELETINLKTEQYKFTCSFLYNHESMVMGNKAKVLIHPLLTLNDRPISTKLITKCVVKATVFND